MIGAQCLQAGAHVAAQVGQVVTRRHLGPQAGKLDTVFGKLGALRVKLGALRVKPGALRVKLGALRVKLSALRVKLSAVLGKLSAVLGKLGALRVKLSALRVKLSALLGKLGALHVKLSALRVKLSAVLGKLGALRVELSALLGKLGALRVKPGVDPAHFAQHVAQGRLGRVTHSAGHGSASRFEAATTRLPRQIMTDRCVPAWTIGLRIRRTVSSPRVPRPPYGAVGRSGCGSCRGAPVGLPRHGVRQRPETIACGAALGPASPYRTEPCRLCR